MIKKILALLLVLLLSVALFACNETEEDTTDDGKIDIETQDTNAEGETGDEVETGSTSAEIGDPGEYNYSERNETVYVNNPDSAVTLRTADYEPKGSIAHGTELKRIGLSTDGANYWSKVIYEEQEYYVATKFLTTIKNPDEGFVEVSKTVQVNDKTGSLNIRNIPAMESTIIGYADAGKDIKVIAENTTTGWYKIEFVDVDGKTLTGYIASDAKYFVQDKNAATEVDTTEATEAGSEANTESASK